MSNDNITINCDPPCEELKNYKWEMKLMQQQIQQDIKDIKNDNKSIKTSLDSFITSADKKYADKNKVDEMEDNIRWVVRLVIGTVLLAVLAVVIKSH